MSIRKLHDDIRGKLRSRGVPPGVAHSFGLALLAAAAWALAELAKGRTHEDVTAEVEEFQRELNHQAAKPPQR